MPIRIQLVHDPARAVAAPGLVKDPLRSGFYRAGRGDVARMAGEPLQVIVKTAAADTHHPAKHRDGIGLHLLPDEAEPQFDSLAKKAVAFFKISRSISRRLFSLRKRLSSASSCSRERPGSAGPSNLSRYCRTHREMLVALTPRRRPVSSQLYPCSMTNRAVSSLNCWVNR